MTGGLTIGESTATEIPLHVKSAATTGSNYIRFYSNGAIVTDVGYSKDLSTHLYNGNLTSHPTLVLGRTNNLTDGMQFRYSNVYYNVLHAGNYQNYPNTKVGVSTIWLYPENSNVINFGGTYTANSTIYFGYNSKDNRPRPTEYHFGQNDASLHGKYFRSHIPTGTQPFQCVSTTTCTNLNADMVDGYHSNDLTKRVFINGIPGGAGSKWIRIGVLKYPSAGDSNTVMITISNSYSYSMNRSVTFIISLTHNAGKPIITQLNGYPAPFSKVRILAPKDSNGSYIYGDRYVDIYYFTSTASGASNVIYLTAINLNYNSTYHFVPNKNFVDGTTIPSNYDEIWNFPFTTGLGSNANIYSQDGSIEGGTLKLSSTSTFSGKATFNGGLSGTLTGSLSGNATTATTLQTSRTINGTSFNGSANITTSYWGTTRTFYINDPSGAHYNSYSVNGSGNVDMYLPSTMTGFSSITSTTFRGSLSGNASSASTATKLTTARTIWGQSFNGTANVSGSLTGVASITASGNITAAGAITAKSSSSDIRLKKNIKEYNALAIIHKLKSVKYYWNDTAKANSPIFNDNEEHYGLIAQDLLINGYSQWVSNCFKDYYVIQYERLIPVLWRGIQQVDNEVATLKKKIATLEKELSSVKRQLSL